MPALLVLAVSGTAGCAGLSGNLGAGLDGQVSVPGAAPPEVVVVLRTGDQDQEPEYLKAPLTETMLVQDALKGSGAIGRFRRMKVVLVRQEPGGQVVRLPVRYDTYSRHVAEATNYAMRPGDRLEVTKDSSTVVDRMVSGVFEPLRPLMRSQGS